jgi:hypothetical protein
MNAQAGSYKAFVAKAGLILAGGLVIMLVFTAALVYASKTQEMGAGNEEPSSRDVLGSYGNIGYPVLTVTPTEETPKFIANPLKEKRGVILLVYVKGATDDEDMVSSFNAVKAKYSGQASFFSFEARDVHETGDIMEQLKASQPPMLAVISGDGSVYQQYTGWIDQKVMEQVVANALRE